MDNWRISEVERVVQCIVEKVVAVLLLGLAQMGIRVQVVFVVVTLEGVVAEILIPVLLFVAKTKTVLVEQKSVKRQTGWNVEWVMSTVR